MLGFVCCISFLMAHFAKTALLLASLSPTPTPHPPRSLFFACAHVRRLPFFMLLVPFLMWSSCLFCQSRTAQLLPVWQ